MSTGNGTSPAIQPETLPGELVAVLVMGADGANPAHHFRKLVRWLKHDGEHSFDAVLDLLRRFPDGIAAGFDGHLGEQLSIVWTAIGDKPPPPAEAGEGEPAPRDVKAGEDQIALAFADLHAGSWLFDHTDRQWYRWTGTRWLTDTRRNVLHTIRDYCRGVSASYKKPKTELLKVRFWRNVETAVAADPRIAFSHEGWNQNGWLLGTPDGTIDLRTGELIAPDPEHRINRFTSVVPAPKGTPHPIWTTFLSQATGKDGDVQTFLQRLAGYWLTADMSEEMLAFFYGPGGNGKGTFIQAIMIIMGSYARAMPIEAFTAGSYINMEYYRAEMNGPRLIVASETEQQAFWSEQMIKDLTGNDMELSGRKPYGLPFTFRPVCKLSIVGNYAPKLKGRTPAMERRLRVTPFTHVPETPDPHLKDKLRSEYPAILRWAIDGCLEWKKHRLSFPKAIKDASGTYFARQDAWKEWLTERCDLSPQYSTFSAKLLANYNAWALAAGEATMTRNAFAEQIDRTPNLERTVVNKGSLIVGVGIKDLRPRPQAEYQESAD